VVENINKNGGVDGQPGKEVSYHIDWAGKTELSGERRQCANANSDRRQYNGLRQLQPGCKRLARTYDDQQARENQEYQRGIEHIGTVWLYPLPLRER
jgi:hypothetical protein